MLIITLIIIDTNTNTKRVRASRCSPNKTTQIQTNQKIPEQTPQTKTNKQTNFHKIPQKSLIWQAGWEYGKNDHFTYKYCDSGA